MQYLKDLRQTRRPETYARLIGELRVRVFEKVNGLLDREESATWLDIRGLILEELHRGQITPELEWYAEGFARGLFQIASAYYRHDLPVELQENANRHNHLGYSAGYALRRRRTEVGSKTRLKGRVRTTT